MAERNNHIVACERCELLIDCTGLVCDAETPHLCRSCELDQAYADARFEPEGAVMLIVDVSVFEESGKQNQKFVAQLLGHTIMQEIIQLVSELQNECERINATRGKAS